MFEAKLVQGEYLKKLPLRELVNEATWDCSENGISLQAMDSSHVSLVSMLLKSEGFETYRCDRKRMNVQSLQQDSEVPQQLGCHHAEGQRHWRLADSMPNQEKVSEYEMKLMDLDAEHLGGIPETDYKAVIRMPSAELAARVPATSPRLADSVTVTVTKDGVVFSASGDLAAATSSCAQTGNATSRRRSMTYSLRYFNIFSKAAPLSPQVAISLTDNVPALMSTILLHLGYIQCLRPKLVQGEYLKKVIELYASCRNERQATWRLQREWHQSAAATMRQQSSWSQCCSSLRGFETYRCRQKRIARHERAELPAKILKCASNSRCPFTLKASDTGDSLTFRFESMPNQRKCLSTEMKLMDLDAEHLGIPETTTSCDQDAFGCQLLRVCRDLTQIGDSLTVTVTKDGVVRRPGQPATSSWPRLGNADKPEEEEVSVELTEAVSMTYSLRYFNIFSKAAHA
uniref:DNA sliding clamp PCNA n=1 Tax=Macrostomum lignano TaxID=282301 RepID=A0A1I8F4T6_9PLAT